MHLRKPCVHERYDQHWIGDYNSPLCPGGEFLSDDALERIGKVIQEQVLEVADYGLTKDQERLIASTIFNVLATETEL